MLNEDEDTDERGGWFGIVIASCILAVVAGAIGYTWGSEDAEPRSATAQQEPQQPARRTEIAHATRFRQPGYDILLSPVLADPSETAPRQARAIMFVQAAPKGKPAELSCALFDKDGAFQGGGGSERVDAQHGSVMQFFVMVAKPGRVSCNLVK